MHRLRDANFMLWEEFVSDGGAVDPRQRYGRDGEGRGMAEKAERQGTWVLGSANSQTSIERGNKQGKWEEMSSKTGGTYKKGCPVCQVKQIFQVGKIGQLCQMC